MKCQKEKQKQKSNLDRYLLGAMVYIIAWSIAFFIAWLALGTEPSTLEGCILAPGIVEMVACAWIKQGKLKHGEDGNGDEGTDNPEADE